MLELEYQDRDCCWPAGDGADPGHPRLREEVALRLIPPPSTGTTRPAPTCAASACTPRSGASSWSGREQVECTAPPPPCTTSQDRRARPDPAEGRQPHLRRVDHHEDPHHHGRQHLRDSSVPFIQWAPDRRLPPRKVTDPATPGASRARPSPWRPASPAWWTCTTPHERRVYKRPWQERKCSPTSTTERQAVRSHLVSSFFNHYPPVPGHPDRHPDRMVEPELPL